VNDNQDLRRNWRTNWLCSVQKFADDEKQRRSWLDPTNTNPHFSFAEYMCCYFDDLGLSDNGYDWALEQGLVSADEVAADFHTTARGYESPTDYYDHRAILADPNWMKVVASAKRAQAALLAVIGDAQERRLLREP
jgi:hypothetical protein